MDQFTDGPPPAGPPPLPLADPTSVAAASVGPETTPSPSDQATPPPGSTGSEGAATLASVCGSCGSQLEYVPGTRMLRCVSCGAEQAIDAAADQVVTEHSYADWLGHHAHTQVASLGGQVAACQGCGAQLETTDLTVACQFCGGHLTLLDQPAGVIAPEAVVPFEVDRTGAQTAFRGWVSSRWFAPGELKKVGSTESLRGTYVPHWTFDAATHTSYTGQRGEHYYVTLTRSVPDGNGGTRTETYQERRTRWYPASGRVARDFDDVLVPASHRVEPDKIDKMGPWQLGDAVPFQPEYLTGYSALRYDVDPQDGSKQAQHEMEQVIDGDVRRDIGGDEQRVDNVNVTYSQEMFKLVLLPLWIATYLYGGKTWQVLVNANTGQVVGDRPWSKLKIAAVVTLAVLVALVAWFLIAGQPTPTDTGMPAYTSTTQTSPTTRVLSAGHTRETRSSPRTADVLTGTR